MIALLLLAAAVPTTAIEAERAFAADAQTLGQWTAFRKWSTDDAVLFVPQPVNAHKFLKGKSDPPVSVFWWPGRSYVSCDGSLAVNTGPWVREWGKSVGYFTTVWQRQPGGGWKWIYDGGDSLEIPRAEGGEVKPQQASCNPVIAKLEHGPITPGVVIGGGTSKDRSLAWIWWILPDGERTLEVRFWDGNAYQTVVDDQVAAPPK